MYDQDHSPARGSKLALITGFSALFVAVVSAYLNPATGYELSVYAATPILFWIGVVVALIVSLSIAFYTSSRGLRTLAFVLGGTAVLLVASLPILRNYYFFGSGDSMTHLGWVKDLEAGTLPMTDIFYPMIHTISVFVSDVAGVSPRRALVFVVPLFVAVFLLFVPLVVRAVTNDDRAVLVAVFSAFLLIPVSHVGVQMTAHPTSQALMYLPAVLFVVVMYVTRRDTNVSILSAFSPAGVLLGLVGVSFLLLHPQQTVNLILLLGTMWAVQFAYRRVRSDHPISDHRSLFGHTAFLAVLFLVWAPRHEQVSGALSGVITSLLTGTGTTSQAAQRLGAIELLGGGIEEFVLKLFLVAAVFSLLAAALGFGAVFHRLDERLAHENSIILYLSVGAIPIMLHFAIYFFGGIGTQYFRHYGFLMVLATILGALALHRGFGRLSGSLSGRHLRVGAMVFLVVSLALAMPVMLRSPYIFQHSHHVTESQMSGYETSFEHHGEGIYYSGVRSSGDRFGDALMGTTYSTEVWWDQYARHDKRTMPEGENFTADYFPTYYEEDHYLPMTSTSRVRETDLLIGLRYPQEGFDSLDRNQRVSRVQDTGEFELYLFDHPRSR